MDGVLVIDKPTGPTSHDVVARARRVLGEKRIGHTGTLDPLASGVLPLVVGRATRLARFLTASEKTYDATIRLGVGTDTADALGEPLGERWAGPWPSITVVDNALDSFRGAFLQHPPAYSAKKIAGERSYRLAREGRADLARPAPVEVTAFAIDLLEVKEDVVRVRLRCSAGFYVRSLAHDLGDRLGTAGHLSALRRTASGAFNEETAIPLSVLDGDEGRARATAGIVPMSRLLQDRPAVVLNAEGLVRVRHGRDIGHESVAVWQGAQNVTSAPVESVEEPIRLMSDTGDLLGLAVAEKGSQILHPAVVLV